MRARVKDKNLWKNSSNLRCKMTEKVNPLVRQRNNTNLHQKAREVMMILAPQADMMI